MVDGDNEKVAFAMLGKYVKFAETGVLLSDEPFWLKIYYAESDTLPEPNVQV